MIKITSQGKLIELLNDSIESKIIKNQSEKNPSLIYSIIQDKKTKEYYRVSWGEVEEDGTTHLWFKEHPVCVKFSTLNGEWQTADERRAQRILDANKKMKTPVDFIVNNVPKSRAEVYKQFAEISEGLNINLNDDGEFNSYPLYVALKRVLYDYLVVYVTFDGWAKDEKEIYDFAYDISEVNGMDLSKEQVKDSIDSYFQIVDASKGINGKAFSTEDIPFVLSDAIKAKGKFFPSENPALLILDGLLYSNELDKTEIFNISNKCNEIVKYFDSLDVLISTRPCDSK